MGTWSFHPMGNDDALDAVDQWFISFPQIEEWDKDNGFFEDEDKVRRFLEQLTPDEINNAIEKAAVWFCNQTAERFYGYVIPYTYLQYSAFDLSDEVKDTLKKLLEESINDWMDLADLASVDSDVIIYRSIALDPRISEDDPDYFIHHLVLFEKYFDDVITGKYNVEDCESLLDVTSDPEDFDIEDGVLVRYYGEDCYSGVEIPEGVTSIEDDAFDGCSWLTSVIIPASVTSIGEDAFLDCGELTSIEVDALNPVYRSENNCLIEKETNTLVLGGKTAVIPSDGSVTSIGDSAFCGRSGLTSITIPDSVTSIGDFAFSGCNGLTSVTIPDSVTSIGENAFNGCRGLTSITIPDSVTSICDGAFKDCSGLTSVTIPKSVTSICAGAFKDCSGLTSVTIPDSVTYIGVSAFDDCSGLTSITIPDSVTYIGDWTFSRCSGLTSIIIPEGVTYIGESAFGGCSGLTSVTIPASMTYIGESAFNGCSGLTSITIPASVTSIGYYAFATCSGLTSVTIPDSVTYIGESAFGGCSGLTVLNYRGTQKQWNDIEKIYEWDEATGNYVIRCLDGDVIKNS